LLGCESGDQIAFRKVGRVVLISVVRASSAIPISDEERREAVKALGA
jgi:hypothetical protein